MKKNKPYPKKKFGQHFLVSPYYIAAIVGAIPAHSTDFIVEIGPGRGALSSKLVQSFQNGVLIEKDRDIIPHLKDNIGYCPTWSVKQADAISFDFDILPKNFHVVGNLPYNVAAIIIKKVFLLGKAVSSATFMVQREVAQRIIAPPGIKDRSFLSVFCQFFGKPNILFHVPPGAFHPIPKVSSSVFQIKNFAPDSNIIPQKSWNDFFKFVSIGFSKRRKKVINNIRSLYKTQQSLPEYFLNLQLDENARAENLEVNQWIALFQVLLDEKK